MLLDHLNIRIQNATLYTEINASTVDLLMKGKTEQLLKDSIEKRRHNPHQKVCVCAGVHEPSGLITHLNDSQNSGKLYTYIHNFIIVKGI